ncbi:MAG: hypothetical protein V4710_21655 [Verrucomicrobiota bacterium]
MRHANSPSTDRILKGNASSGTVLGRNRFIFNDAFVFDLTSFDSPATSATFSLMIKTPNGGTSGYVSADLTETISLFDVSTLHTVFETDQSVAPGPFADLQSGTLYASQVVSATDNGTKITFTLNAAALNDIQTAAGGFFVIGANLSSLGGTGSQFVNVGDAKLDLSFDPAPVPEPVTAFFGLGLTAVALSRRMRRR